jgi:diguanylate cyclase (GGDEF)-like protein
MPDTAFAIDSRTMLIVMLTSCLLMAAVLWFASAGKFRDGLGKWTASLGVQAGAWLLFSTQDFLPGLLSIVAANALFALSWSLQFAAILEFRRHRVPPWLLWAPAGLVPLFFLAFMDNPQVRLGTGGLLYGMAYVLLAAVLLRGRPQHRFRARRLLALCYLAGAAVLAARGVAAWLAPQEFDGALASNAYQTLLYLGLYAGIIGGSLAFLLMHKERSEDEKSRMATTDPLTGVFNRRTFLELAEQELARARRSRAPIALMMLDLDHFKEVNDTHGHLIGDEVLVGFTRLVRDCVRRGDLVVRYGGEEFCVLLPATPLAAASALAERIRTAMAATTLTARPFRVTVSIGLTCYTGERDVSVADLLSRADEALYRAKEEGRDRVIALPFDEPGKAQRPLPFEATG